MTYIALRRWSDAEHELTHALALDPHNALAARFLARTYINSTGDIRRARQAFEGVPAESKINVQSSRVGQYCGDGRRARIPRRIRETFR